MKLVSVIIPVYNVERYIAAAIQSVLEQTYPHFELIIVDDSSPDRSSTICQQFTDARIQTIQQPNRGLAGARNTGIRNAKGDYIAFLDGDDIWLPDKLEKHLEHLERSPEVGVSFSRSALVDETGAPLGTYLMPRLTNITLPYLLRENPIGNGSAALLRREVFQAIQFEVNLRGTPEICYFDEELRQSEDVECWWRIVVKTPWQIEGIPEALTLYRVNASGLSANFAKQLDNWERAIAKVRAIAPEQIVPQEKLARAYTLRYLARNAVRQKTKQAPDLIHRALLTDRRILLEEPRRTMLTWAAAYLIWVLPKPIYTWAERWAQQVAGRMQQQKIQSDRQK